MTDPREPRIDIHALAKEYLKATVSGFMPSDVENLVTLLALVEYEAKLDAICLAAREAEQAAADSPLYDLSRHPSRDAFVFGATRAATRIRKIKPVPLKRGGT